MCPSEDPVVSWRRTFTERTLVGQATGVVMQQLGFSAADAEVYLRAVAWLTGVSVGDVAVHVVSSASEEAASP
jgi:AmiR/NasT family two-component response regulator